MFNVFQTFYRAAGHSKYAWVQVIDGRVVQAFTEREFKHELRLLAR